MDSKEKKHVVAFTGEASFVLVLDLPNRDPFQYRGTFMDSKSSLAVKIFRKIIIDGALHRRSIYDGGLPLFEYVNAPRLIDCTYCLDSQ